MTCQSSLSPADAGLRVPPHNLEAEQALLGALMLRNAGIDEVAEMVRPDHFADPVHGRIYAAILALADRGERPNPVTLKSYFAHDSQLSEIGGTAYLAQLANSVVIAINPGDYAGIIRDLADRRSIIEACTAAMAEAYDPRWEVPAGGIVETLEVDLTAIAADAANGGKPEPIAASMAGTLDMVERLYKGERQMIGVPTGFSRLDDKIKGLEPGNLYLLGGRPSMGKSVAGENIARFVAGLTPAVAAAGAVVVFSLEMSRDQLNQRALAAVTEVPFHAIRDGRLRRDEFEKVAMAGGELSSLPLFVDDSPGLSPSAMRARARRIKRKHGLRLVVVDHLHLVSGAGGENRNNELASITKALKALAKELAAPVLLLAQLNRSVEQREDKRPQLSDLRESGAIEQDADAVMFVFREQYYLERGEPHRRADEGDEKFNDRFTRWQRRCEEVWNTGEIIVAKQRNGPVGTVRLGFSGQYQRFDNIADDGEERHAAQ